jgi:hypothetical protein
MVFVQLTFFDKQHRRLVEGFQSSSFTFNGEPFQLHRNPMSNYVEVVTDDEYAGEVAHVGLHDLNKFGFTLSANMLFPEKNDSLLSAAIFALLKACGYKEFDEVEEGLFRIS